MLIISNLVVFRKCSIQDHAKTAYRQIPLGMLRRYRDLTKENIMKDRKKLGLGMAIGIAIGTAIGVALDNIAVWVAIGVALGAGIGKRLDQVSRKEE